MVRRLPVAASNMPPTRKAKVGDCSCEAKLPAKLARMKKIAVSNAPNSETVEAKKYLLRQKISQIYNVVN